MGKPLNQDDPKVLVKSDGVALPHVVVDVSGDSQSGMLQALATDRQVVVNFTGLSAHCINLFPTTKDAPKERQILFDVTGRVEPGEVLALMGPSGSGKTSLLSILGRRSTVRVTGDITFNGRQADKAVKRRLGFVTQDDLLYPDLTVDETLFYAAMLRLPKTYSRERKLARVDDVLHALGLGKCRSTIIGGGMRRGVSGGERKRVAIGHELLTDPSILFLDEPTSGLDSTTALKLMQTLRSLASGGRTMITSIHQPSSRLYQHMDKLMLLSEGHTIFYGSANLASAWFEKQGCPSPFGVNISDHMLDLACGECGDVGEGQESGQAVRERLVAAFEGRKMGLGKGGITNVDMFPDSEHASSASGSTSPSTEQNARGSVAERGSPKVAEERSAFETIDLGSDVEQATREVASSKGKEALVSVASTGTSTDEKWGASWLQQVSLLASRSLKTRRFTALSTQKMLQLLAVAILSGLFWFQLGGNSINSIQGVSDIGGLLFFAALFIAFTQMFQAIFTFPAEVNMIIKERQSGMYRLSAYYIARVGSELPMDLSLPTIFMVIVYFMTGLRLDAGAFFANLFTSLLITLVAQSYGLAIGAWISDPQSAQTVATIFTLGLMLVGGFYVAVEPIWISWMRYVSFIYWGWNLLLKIEFRHRAFPCDAIPGILPGTTNCQVNDAGVYNLDLNEPVTKEVMILLAMLIFLRMVIYFALQRATSFKKQN